MNHPLTEKILEEFDRKFKPTPNGATGVNLIMQQIIEKHNEDIKDFLRSTIQRTANEFRVEEMEWNQVGGREHKKLTDGYNQCAKETNAKVDSFNPKNDER